MPDIEIVSGSEYLEELAMTRDARMRWWREARFGMFIHFGLYALLGRGEWAMAYEGIDAAEYAKLADSFFVREDAAEQWVRLAKSAGMKYAVLTTRHHDGFSLWDSKANPFNSVNYGSRRDIVREFVDACGKHDIRVGLYSSLMDWRHPDGARAAYDARARRRFLDYIFALNEELLTNYGKIDILWYDAGFPMEHAEGWDSLSMNQRLRALQPGIIINDRSWLPEDFTTPEGHLPTSHLPEGDWEACMTFNNLSWGYVDSDQAAQYSYNDARILQTLATCAAGGGNLLLNIGPAPDGGVPEETRAPLESVGRWLERYGESVYGGLSRNAFWTSGGCTMATQRGNTVYMLKGVWPSDGCARFGGFTTRLVSARLVGHDAKLTFEQNAHQVVVRGLPRSMPAGLNVPPIALEFESPPKHIAFPATPAMHNGRRYAFT